jgi:hypothetical protein
MTRPDTREDILSLAECPFCKTAEHLRITAEERESEVWGGHVHCIECDCMGGHPGYWEESEEAVRAAIVANWNNALAPTPPAAEAPGQEPVAWQELMQEAADALRIFTGHDSQPNLKHRYGEHWWEPVNALRDKLIAIVSAPPTYADAEAKGFERGIEAAAHRAESYEAQHELNAPLANQVSRNIARAIRSLASPAPKEPGQ